MGQGKSSCLECFDVPDFIVGIKTGDTKGAGLHNAVYVTFINEEGVKSREIHLNGCCVTVFKKGRTDEFNVSRLSGFGQIKSIILQQHEEQGDVDWYVDKVTIRHTHDDGNGKVTVFPVNRWMRPNKPLAISAFDSSLPQHDEHPDQRKCELIRKQAAYGYHRIRDLPAQIRMLPREEIYSNFHKLDIKSKKAHFLNSNRQLIVEPIAWESIEELQCLFKEKGKLSRPSCMDAWKSDIHFGKQRIIGCNPKSIQLCTELPENFGANGSDLEQFLEEKTFEEAMEKKKIFIVNHKILDGLADIQNNNKIPSPIALFYLNTESQFVPIAIQLYQEKSESNPVFFPTDQEYVWLAAKMWFNCADSAFHRSCLLFAGTHMVLEMIAISVHRHLSPSHPIFRLLGPYLRFVLSINNFEMSFLTAPGGWMDYATNIGVNGMNELIKR
eukprot:gene8395-14372_t